jgi:CRP/FNR family transcriptional regulator, cyclic AMP receptor protein
MTDVSPSLFDNLREMEMFSSLNDAEIAKIVDKIIVRDYRKDQVILSEGDTSSHMYLVLSGRVKVVQTTEDGKEIIRAIHKAGDSFGELSLLDCEASPAEVVAIEPTSAAVINRDNFLTIIHTQGKVLDNLLLMFCKRLRYSWDRVQMVNLKNSEQRVNMLFQQLSATHGKPVEEGTLLNIKLTHQTLASMTGLCRETVTRALDALKKNKCIKIQSGDKKVILLPGFLKFGIDY